MASLQSASLDFVHRDIVCTIFQDCVDQLGIIGGIIPNYAAKPSALDNVSIEILELVVGVNSQGSRSQGQWGSWGPRPPNILNG